ncbi:MAG: hypothetical protein ABIM99_06210 [Candidatus Dojkabacteria bacterium]
MKKFQLLLITVILSVIGLTNVQASDVHYWLFWQPYMNDSSCPEYANGPELTDGLGTVYNNGNCNYLLSFWATNLIPESFQKWEVTVPEQIVKLIAEAQNMPQAPELPFKCWDLKINEVIDFQDGRICEREESTTALYYFSDNGKLNVRRWDNLTHEKLSSEDFVK